jgi:hypothetical protein
MKKINKFILLSITLFSIFSFTNISEFEKIIIFYDDFEDNRNNWLLDTEFSKGNINNSIYELSSLGQRSDIRVQNIDLINEVRDFEIEASIKIIGESKFSNSIIWGTPSMGGQYEEGLSFGINSQQRFIGLKTEDWLAHDLFGWQDNLVIKQNAFNKLLVKKELGKYHFYINNILVKTLQAEAFRGQNFGFHAANGATIQIDYLKISVFLPRA